MECDTRPCFGYPDGTVDYCDNHKKEDMIDLVHNKLKCPKCNTRASFGYPDEKLRYCSTHKEKGMIDLENKCCDICTIQISVSSYGYSGEKKTRCHLHARRNMLRHPKTWCQIEECEERAVYGESIPTYCETHRKETDFDLRLQKCRECKQLAVLTSSLPNEDTLSVSPEGGLCGDCDPEHGYRVHLSKQREIKKYFDRKGIQYDSYDRMIEGEQNLLERPDFYFANKGKKHAVIVEVDEEQHLGREHEEERMFRLIEHIGRPIIFIRYNPDKYKVGEESKRTEGESQRRRKRMLLEIVQEALELKAKRSRIVYLYYDGWNITTAEEVKYQRLVQP